MFEIPTEKWLGLWWRIPLCLLVLLGAARFFVEGLKGMGIGVVGSLLLAVACLIVAAALMAPPLAEWGAACLNGLFGGMLYPERRSRRPPPVYGPAEARRLEGDYEGAIQAYEDILAEFPDNARAYLGLMDIAWLDLTDAPRALAFYNRALAAIKDEACRKEFQQAYEDFAPYLAASKPSPAKPSTRRYLSG